MIDAIYPIANSNFFDWSTIDVSACYKALVIHHHRHVVKENSSSYDGIDAGHLNRSGLVRLTDARCRDTPDAEAVLLQRVECLGYKLAAVREPQNAATLRYVKFYEFGCRVGFPPTCGDNAAYPPVAGSNLYTYIVDDLRLVRP